MWSLLNFLRDNADKDKEDDDDYHDDEKLSAVYGEEWKDKSPENLMDDKYFREIPEFLLSKRKILTCESVSKRKQSSSTKSGLNPSVLNNYNP